MKRYFRQVGSPLALCVVFAFLLCSLEETSRAATPATENVGLNSASKSNGLQPGANVLPYEIHNTATGEEYCQMCAYAERAGTIAVYGNLHDEQFWGDLEKLQALQSDHKNFGCFGQVLDSADTAAISAEAKKHHLTIPVVYAVDPDWVGVYKVGGVSRTVYYSNQFKILWTGIGLDAPSSAKLDEAIKANSRG